MVSRQDIYCQRGKYSHYLTLHIIFCVQNVGKMFSPCHLGLGFKLQNIVEGSLQFCEVFVYHQFYNQIINSFKF